MARSVLDDIRNGGDTMLIHLHSHATTTPKTRATIQASAEPVSVLADLFGVTEQKTKK